MSALYFQICFYVSIVLLTLTIFVCVGKFFCVSWIESIYDAIAKNELIAFLLLFTLAFALLFVISYSVQIEILMGFCALFGTAITVMTLICLICVFCIEYLFPFMEQLHYDIRRKRGK